MKTQTGIMFSSIRSRTEPVNQNIIVLPGRGKRFSLSPGERAGVRVSVKLIIPRAFTSIEARYHLSLTRRIHGEGGRYN
jgi:hypothetical protein